MTIKIRKKKKKKKVYEDLIITNEPGWSDVRWDNNAEDVVDVSHAGIFWTSKIPLS